MLNTITNVLTATSSELSSLLSNVTATTSTASVGDMLFALILGVVMGFLISLVLHLHPQEIRLYPELCYDIADAAADRGNCAGDDQLNGKCPEPCGRLYPLSVSYCSR